MVSVYVLRDPRDNEIRYVGASGIPSERLLQHTRSQCESTRAWCKELRLAGLRPALEVVRECSEEEWPEAERVQIAELRAAGADLLNRYAGGERGWKVGSRHLPETIEKITEKLAGTKKSSEHVATVAAAMKGTKRPDLAEYNRTRVNPNLGKRGAWKRPDTAERNRRRNGNAAEEA